VFEAYLEHSLAPELKEGRVVVMDNLAAHKPDRVRELIEDRGCELVYLPPYSPDCVLPLGGRLELDAPSMPEASETKTGQPKSRERGRL